MIDSSSKTPPQMTTETTPLVMLVDDDPYFRSFISSVLIESGYEVMSVSMPLSALELAKQCPPQLVIFDGAMPQMNGLDFIERLHFDGYRGPSIFLSASARTILESPSKNSFCERYDIQKIITKPVQIEKLLSEIQQVLPFPDLSSSRPTIEPNFSHFIPSTPTPTLPPLDIFSKKAGSPGNDLEAPETELFFGLESTSDEYLSLPFESTSSELEEGSNSKVQPEPQPTPPGGSSELWVQATITQSFSVPGELLSAFHDKIDKKEKEELLCSLQTPMRQLFHIFTILQGNFDRDILPQTLALLIKVKDITKELGLEKLNLFVGHIESGLQKLMKKSDDQFESAAWQKILSTLEYTFRQFHLDARNLEEKLWGEEKKSVPHTQTTEPKVPLQLLLVDDDEIDAYLIKKSFAKQNSSRYQLSWAKGREEAQRMLDTKEYDLCLCDDKVDEDNGFDFYRAVRKNGHELPFIMLMGVYTPSVGLKAAQEGISFCIPKEDFSAPHLERTIQHVLQEKKSKDLLKEQTNRDPLTHLLNPVAFKKRLDESVNRACVGRSPLCVMFMDLDHFKEVNDQFGHHVGDQMLQEVSKRLKSELRAGDFAGRMGGDEFALCLDHGQSHEEIDELARKLLLQFEEYILTDKGPLKCELSIGIAIHPRDGVTSKELLESADQAMYRAKKTAGSSSRQQRKDN